MDNALTKAIAAYRSAKRKAVAAGKAAEKLNEQTRAAHARYIELEELRRVAAIDLGKLLDSVK